MKHSGDQYLIKMLGGRFSCPVCGERISKGDNYIDIQGLRVCIKCGLPTRRLKFIGIRAVEAEIK
jgi:predicted RNA-binding Zn-ribbon protein involved in translation (DUF1610 family)